MANRIGTYFLVVGFSSFLLLNACSHDVALPSPSSPQNPSDTTTQNQQDTALCFERDILPIFISNCAKSGCHDAITREEGFQFTSYETITAKDFEPGDLDATELYEKITEDDHDKRMPPPPNAPLTSEQITLIRDWILRGAPNTKDCTTGCDSNQFKFAADIQPIINKYCLGCHNDVNLSGGYSYETYEGFLQPVQNGRLLGAIKHQAGYQPMPRGGNQLSDCEIKQIEKWIADGAQNN